MTDIFRSMSSSSGAGSTRDRGEFHLESEETISVNDDGTTWVKIPNMVANALSVGFAAAGGTLTKTSRDGTFLMNGVSDLEVNKACTVYYGLFLNGSIVAGEITPHTFTVQSKVENISITAIAELALDDEVEIKVLGDGVTSGVTVTAHKLDVTFWG